MLSFFTLVLVCQMQILRNRLVATARKCMGKDASLGQVYDSMQEAYQHMQTPLIYQEPSARVYSLVYCFVDTPYIKKLLLNLLMIKLCLQL